MKQIKQNQVPVFLFVNQPGEEKKTSFFKKYDFTSSDVPYNLQLEKYCSYLEGVYLTDFKTVNDISSSLRFCSSSYSEYYKLAKNGLYGVIESEIEFPAIWGEMHERMNEEKFQNIKINKFDGNIKLNPLAWKEGDIYRFEPDSISLSRVLKANFGLSKDVSEINNLRKRPFNLSLIC